MISLFFCLVRKAISIFFLMCLRKCCFLGNMTVIMGRLGDPGLLFIFSSFFCSIRQESIGLGQSTLYSWQN